MNEKLVSSNEQLRKNNNKGILLIVLCYLLIFLSCTRQPSVSNTNPYVSTASALPSAILQTGEHPIWFQLTERGIVNLESIEDAVNTAAFIPWPLAVHVRFFREKDNELVMAVNRDGFIKLAPHENGIILYHFSGGEFWKQYTIGGFEYYSEPGMESQPIILLYLDDRFLDSNSPLPNPRIWTFNMESNTPFPINIVTLELFSADEGWDMDTLRLGEDGYWYYRVIKKTASQPEIQMRKTPNLAQAGINISIEDFFNSVSQESAVQDANLPPLPQGFVYTGIANIGDSLFASWEEQNEYSIGAAGFMLIRH